MDRNAHSLLGLEGAWLGVFVAALSVAYGIQDLWEPAQEFLSGPGGPSRFLALSHLVAISIGLAAVHLGLLGLAWLVLAWLTGLLQYRVLFRTGVLLASVAFLALSFAGVELYDAQGQLGSSWYIRVGSRALLYCVLGLISVAVAIRGQAAIRHAVAVLAGLVILGLAIPLVAQYRPLPQRVDGPADGPNVILYVIDTLRADHLGTYGYHRDTSPAIDALARTGVVFERAYVVYTASTASHATIQTGCLPFHHGAIFNGMEVRDEVTLVAEAFREAGYATAAFHNHLLLSDLHGFRQGFDTFVETHRPNVAGAGLSVLRAELHLLRIWDVFMRRQTVMPLALDWIDSAPEPFFLWITTAQPHTPYRPPSELIERFQVEPYDGPMDGRVSRSIDYSKLLSEADLAHMVDRYDGEVAWADEDVAKLIEHLEARNLRDRTLVIVTADHGEALGEHGCYFEHGALYEESVRVPLILSLPGQIEPRRVKESVGLVDLGATLLRLAHVRSDPSFCDGRDLSELWSEGAQPRPPVVSWKHEKLAAMDEEWKLILQDWNGKDPELYNLEADPGETVNVAAQHPEQRDRLRQVIREACLVSSEAARYCEQAKTIDFSGFGSDNIERLRALGYID